MATLLAAEERTQKLTIQTRCLVAERTTSKLRRAHLDELAEKDEQIFQLQLEVAKANSRAAGLAQQPMGDVSAPAKAAGVPLGGTEVTKALSLDGANDYGANDAFAEFARSKGTSFKGDG